ncbi:MULTISPECIES: RNaseH domain-containing protein [Catenuloplanes]|uniref:RNaseH domain-containing protein n=1 Tax=Catenuloplanes TaxID=33874 RepID=UPI000B1AB4CC
MEIAIPWPGTWSPRQLATLTARFCDHTIVWDDRTVAPLPLHLATRADVTHPDHRSEEEV